MSVRGMSAGAPSSSRARRQLHALDIDGDGASTSIRRSSTSSVPDYWLHTASLRFEPSNRYSLTLGIRNVFDKKPPKISCRGSVREHDLRTFRCSRGFDFRRPDVLRQRAGQDLLRSTSANKLDGREKSRPSFFARRRMAEPGWLAVELGHFLSFATVAQRLKSWHCCKTRETRWGSWGARHGWSW